MSAEKGEEFIVDSGTPIHMISREDLNSGELETVTISTSPPTFIIAIEETRTNEEAIIYAKENIF